MGFLLVGCQSKDDYTKDKNGFIEYIIQLDNNFEYNKGLLSLQKGEDFISYDFIIGINDIYVNEQRDNQVTSYHYNSEGYYISTTYYADTKEIIKITESIYSTKSDFINLFVDYNIVKLNIDFHQVNQYSRTEHLGIPGDPNEWDNIFTFNSDFVYNTTILGEDISLTNVRAFFKTYPVNNSKYLIDELILTGYINNEMVVIKSNRN